MKKEKEDSIMSSGMRKTTFREIKSSFGRYMAILLIVALGVGFFSGLKISYEVMIHSANGYWERLKLFDYQLVSTIGFDENASEVLMKQEDVLAAEGAKSADVLMRNEDGVDMAFKILSITDTVNTVELLEGRMPENETECIVDVQAFTADDLGKKVTVSGNNEAEDADNFKVQEYTIVGLVRSPLYALLSRGNTDVGDGSLSGYIYVDERAFDMDYDTEIYVVFDQDGVIYSDEYKDFMETRETIWEGVTQTVADARYDRIYAEAMEEITDGEKELSEKKQEGEQELSDAWKEITDGKQELADGIDKLSSAKKTLADNEKTFEKEQEKYEKGRKEYDKGKKEYDKGKKEYDKGKAAYDKGLAEYNVQYKSYKDALEQYNNGKVAYDAAEKEYAAAKAQFDTYKDYMSLEERTKTEAELATWRGKLDATATQLATAKAQLDAAAPQLEQAKATLDATDKQLIAAKKKLDRAKKELDEAKKQLDDGKKQIDDAKQQFADAKIEIASNERKLEDAKIELLDGEKEYEEGKKEFEEKIADAEKEIADGKEELRDLEKPEVYVLGRETNMGYASFENDSAIISGVAKVFPVFFFMVAAMVCMTTMSRMVEEQRTQIGVLKALGYSSASIIGKYLTYSGSAALIGSVLGYFGGTWLFSIVIWISYKMMYDMGDMSYVMDIGLLVVSTLVAFLCSAGTTFVSCRQELNDMAATLMRPKAPKAGKRVLLEKIAFVWNRLKFLDKVSVRNLFRYKRRFFMMIIGVSGCTALLVAAFGVKDSIGTIAETQYNEISLYDMMVNIDEEPNMVEGITDTLLLSGKSADILVGDKTKGENLLIISEEDAFGKYMNLRTKEGEQLSLPGDGEIAIPFKLADRFELSVGDVVRLQNSDLKGGDVTVSAIYESYIDNYVLLQPDTYEALFGESVEYNLMFANVGNDEDVYKVSSSLMKQDCVSRVSISKDMKEQITDMLKSLYYVVVLVIAFGAMLAFVVIYNLNNINITERIREIATIKVLGFYKEETNSYVFRENAVLTLLGSLLGLVLGWALHGFALSEIQVDMVAFDIHIEPVSYVISVVLTLLFNQIVNWTMTGKLEQIDMAESLKSVE